jgi:mannose-6-phosphate isomerase-like protein (cupin superfamily)
MSDGWQSTHIEDIARTGRTWRPIRMHFGIRAFGVNAWSAESEGDDVISEHVEESGHDELYVVTAGHAIFTLNGEELDAPAGTYVYVEPGTTRKAVAKEAGTTILSIGAKPGEAFEIQNWEANAEMWPLYEAGDYEGAIAVLEKALEREREGPLLYNLACMEAMLGRREDAVEHLLESLEGAPERFIDPARNDSDLDSIKDDPRVVELLSSRS